MFYLVSYEYVGPNKRDFQADFKNIVYGHYVDLQSIPGTTNMSHEPCTNGWLGTTNDWASYAHGEYQSLDDARAERGRLFPQTFEREVEDDLDLYLDTDGEGNVIEVLERLYIGAGENVWDAREWAWDAASSEITAGMDDNALDAKAQEYEAIAQSDGVVLWGDVVDVFRKIRDDKRAEIEDD